VIEKVSDAHLSVASSMRTYNSEDDKVNLRLFDELTQLPHTEHVGAVNQTRLRDIASRCRAMSYPCTFAETSCISAMEAMAAGCVVVSTVHGAMPETAWRNLLVPMREGWLEEWVAELVHILTDDEAYLRIAKRNLALAPFMDWDYIADQWLAMISDDLKKA
jgi:glycosyltransferase involved in cell wall biosynthesis